MRTPRRRKASRWRRSRRSSCAASRGRTPPLSISCNSRARRSGPSSGASPASASLRKGPSARSVWRANQPSTASRTSSRNVAGRRPSAGSSWTRASSRPRPGARRAIRVSSQQMPSALRVRPSGCCAAAVNSAARLANRPGRWRSAAASSNLRSAARASGSTTKRKPSRWPIGSSSTSTAPDSFSRTGSRPASFPALRISTVVRRLTNRSVRRAWSASDSRVSTARARAAMSSRASTQSGRCAI